MENKVITRKEMKIIEDQFIDLVDRKTLEKEMSFALQAINKSALLAKCSLESKQQSLLNVANTGLTLNPTLNFAYLVPRWDNIRKEYVCTLMPSYQGLIKLLTDSGSVTSCLANIVREGDNFEYEIGTQSKIVHKPKLGNKGSIIGVYAVATLFDGSKQIEVLDESQINSVREMSESYKAYKDGKIKSCVWVDHYEEMARKTAIKRLSKYLPKTERWSKVANAIEQDNQDYIMDAFSSKAEYLLELAAKCYDTGGRDYKDISLRIANGMTETEASKLIEQLKRDMPSQVTHGGHLPNQRQTSEHVKSIAANVD